MDHFLVRKNDDGVITGINIANTNIWIPFDPANRHYQQYLAWLEEGNVPEEWTPEAPQ